MLVGGVLGLLAGVLLVKVFELVARLRVQPLRSAAILGR